MPEKTSVLMVVIMKDGALVGSEVFPPGTYRLGRAPGEDLQLEDPQVSAHHASFALRNGQIGIRDDGSANGLFVNGKKVSVVRVTSKDEIQVGAYTLKMRVMEKSDPARRAPEGESTLESTIIADMPREPQGDPEPGGRHVAVTAPPAEPQQRAQAAKGSGAARKARGAPDILTPRPMPGRAGAAAKVAPREVPKEPSAEEEAPPTDRFRVPPPDPELGKTTTPSDKLHLVIGPEPPKGRRRKAAREAAEEVAAAAARAKAKKVEQPARRAPAARVPEPPPKARMGASAMKSAPVAPPGSAKPPAPGSPPPVLRAHLIWGDSIVQAQALEPEAKLKVGPRDGVRFPLYGWPLPKDVFDLAAFEGGAWQVSVPPKVEPFQIGASGGPGAAVPSWSDAGFSVRPVAVQRDAEGLGRLRLQPGEGVRLEYGRVSVELRAELPAPPVPVSWKPEMDRSVSVPFVSMLVIGIAFLLFMPKRSELPDFTPKALPAIRAILQPPKKKEAKPKTRLEKAAERIVKEQKEERRPQRSAPQRTSRREVQLPTPQTQAISAIQKIMSRSAGTKQLFSAVSKMGRGGGGMNFKASGLLGKVPLALNGTGGFTIGGAYGKGGSTKGGWAFGLGGLGGPGGMARGKVGRGGVRGGVVSAPSRGGHVSGMLPMEAVRRVVDQHISEVQECYENGLLRNPGLAGKLVVEWTISTAGTVSRVNTKVATLQSNQVSDCIIGHLKTWRFPKPSGGTVVVSYPFIFKSVGG